MFIFAALYYFSLLAIISAATVTTSLFVLLERDGRVQRTIPVYLRWLAAGHGKRYRAYERADSRAAMVNTEDYCSFWREFEFSDVQH